MSDITEHKRIVVVIDMCNSTAALEDLRKQGRLRRLARLLHRSMAFLEAEGQERGFTVYKFTGDGWILLFPDNADAGSVLGAAKAACLFLEPKLRSQFCRCSNTTIR
jgi:hypothetical protein